MSTTIANSMALAGSCGFGHPGGAFGGMLSLAFSNTVKMSNRLTRVPDGDPPALPSAMGPVIVIADWFMVAMLSRPSKGSMRRTWVTPATLWLALATVLVFIASLWLAMFHL